MSLTNDDLALLADSFCQFKELELVFCEGFGTKGLSKVAYNCRFFLKKTISLVQFIHYESGHDKEVIIED